MNDLFFLLNSYPNLNDRLLIVWEWMFRRPDFKHRARLEYAIHARYHMRRRRYAE
jgi:hypothetical protein